MEKGILTLMLMCSNVLCQDGAPRDFCEADTFSVHCPKNQIIFMTSALYGRMKVGTCVKKDLGHIGCYSDVMRQADNRCSGKRACQIRIPDSEFDSTRPCHEELKTYLEAGYLCLQVETPKDNSCHGDVVHPFTVHINSGVGHISSNLHSTSSKCSSESSPIRIVALPGQRLNITVFDFRHSISGSTNNGAGNDVGSHIHQQWLLQGRIRRSGLNSSTITTVSNPSSSSSSSPSSTSLEYSPSLHHPPILPTSSSSPSPLYRAAVWQRNQLRIKRNINDHQKHPKKPPPNQGNNHLHQDGDCSFHVVIQDRHAARKIRVCPSQLRQRSVYVSLNHSLEIYFKKEIGGSQREEMLDEDSERFLVRYEVLGCEDMKISDDMWKNKASNTMEVGCRDNDHKWLLNCVKSKWEGVMGNCSKAALFGILAINDSDLNSLPHGMAIAVVLCVALLMGLTVLIIGALGLLLRRFHKKSNRHSASSYHGPPGKHGSGSLTPSQRMLPANSANMLNSQEFYDYSDPRQRQQQQHYQQQQPSIQRCVGCNAALADYYATLSHRRCIIPQCEDIVSTSAASGTILSDALLDGNNRMMEDGKLSENFEGLDGHSKYSSGIQKQQFYEPDYIPCTMAGGVCVSKPSYELGSHLSNSSMWKKPNYCPVLDDKGFPSRMESHHNCT